MHMSRVYRESTQVRGHGTESEERGQIWDCVFFLVDNPRSDPYPTTPNR